MKSLLIYFLQVSISSSILYGYYHLFLRNKRFHQYNRFYLLAITVISLGVPFLNIPVYFNSRQDIPFVYQLLSDVRLDSNSKTSFWANLLSWEIWGQSIYWLTATLIFIRFSIALIKLRWLLNKYQAEEMSNISFVNTTEKGTPYSFLHWLFWNKKILLNSDSGQKIFRHELFHIQQKHSWDIIYLELLTSLCWINPFFHLVKKEVKAIHEFLADQFAVGHDSKWEYAELLVMQVLQTRQRLVNPFFHNQIKRRIAMITNSSKPSYQYLRKAMVLPVAAVAITLIAINCTSKDTSRNQDLTITNNTDLKKENSSATQLPDTKIFEKVEIEPAFPGAKEGWVKYLQKNLNATVPVDNGAPEGQYTVTAQFIVDANGDISDLKALTNYGYGMEEEVLRIIAKGPKWEPAVQDGKKVNAYRRQPVTFVIQAD
jgi:bla regulator protein blaR1